MNDPIDSHYQRQAISEGGMELPSRYTHPDSVDNWRHTRLLDLTAPLRRAAPGARWITVGDGRYGSDAAYLAQHGVDVIATSLTSDKLEHAKACGYIPQCRAVNAERIPFADREVDLVLCKEAYHHFPRPPIALYEMLRVARIGVVLIEPVDNPRLLDGAKRLAKRLLRGDREMQFEPSGNFLYRLNLRELAKLLTAMGQTTFAYRHINDFYHPGFARAAGNALNLASLATRLGIAAQDLLCASGLLGYGLAGIVVFNGEPGPQLRAALTGGGFRVIDLPRNPYLD